eukprot:scaffold102904_cov67-Phaeocystis_antarctica.AAC.2
MPAAGRTRRPAQAQRAAGRSSLPLPRSCRSLRPVVSAARAAATACRPSGRHRHHRRHRRRGPAPALRPAASAQPAGRRGASALPSPWGRRRRGSATCPRPATALSGRALRRAGAEVAPVELRRRLVVATTSALHGHLGRRGGGPTNRASAKVRVHHVMRALRLRLVHTPRRVGLAAWRGGRARRRATGSTLGWDWRCAVVRRRRGGGVAARHSIPTLRRAAEDALPRGGIGVLLVLVPRLGALAVGAAVGSSHELHLVLSQNRRGLLRNRHNRREALGGHPGLLALAEVHGHEPLVMRCGGGSRLVWRDDDKAQTKVRGDAPHQRPIVRRHRLHVQPIDRRVAHQPSQLLLEADQLLPLFGLCEGGQ